MGTKQVKKGSLPIPAWKTTTWGEEQGQTQLSEGAVLWAPTFPDSPHTTRMHPQGTLGYIKQGIKW